MEDLFARRSAQARMHEGPLGEHIDAFMCTLVAKGYSNDSLRRAAWLVGDFSRWLARHRTAADELTPGHVDAFLRGRKRRRVPRYEDRPTLLRLMAHLADRGVIVMATEAQSLTPAQQLEARYVAYMREERNLAPATIHSNRMEARRLLASLFEDGEARLEHIGAQDIIEHVRRVTRVYRPSSAGRVVGCLRSFLRFAHCIGLVWGATFRMSGATTSRMAGGEELKAA
jgi:hypothetical protein